MTVYLVMTRDLHGQYYVHSVWLSEALANKALKDARDFGHVDEWKIQE